MMDRSRIAAVIRALLAKTTENGATEAEAMAAAEKAREFMDKYRIAEGEVGMEAEGVDGVTVDKGHYKTLQIKDRIALAVAAFTDCKVWTSGGKLKFFGLRSDADFAVWLIDSLEAFVKRSVAEFMVRQSWQVARQRWETEKAFVLGASYRISERLTQAANERKRQAPVVGDGRSLVVLKNAVVDREFAKLGFKLRTSSRRGAAIRDGGAYGAGRAAGDRASFGRPVGGSGGVRMITSR